MDCAPTPAETGDLVSSAAPPENNLQLRDTLNYMPELCRLQGEKALPPNRDGGAAYSHTQL